MSLSVLGLFSIASEPVPIDLPSEVPQKGKRYSLRIVTTDKRFPNKFHYFPMEVYVSSQEESLFLQQAKRGNVFLLGAAKLINRSGTSVILTTYKDISFLEVAWWHSNPRSSQSLKDSSASLETEEKK